ncbi:MAG: glycerophosphodiester phosphodiesterase [Candidatus Kariarchaeaceae archaeon]|jgi:glycerophosphoryl diester phosphodiesterase
MLTHIIAHRGLPSGDIDENTATAFQAAFDIGCDGIELDVHLTSDNRWVIHHDATYNHPRAELSRLSSSELKKIAEKQNKEITFLEEVYEQHKGKRINIECKPNSMKTGFKLVKFLEEKGIASNTNISSFHTDTLLGARAASRSIKLSLLGLFLISRRWKGYHSQINLFSLNPYYLFVGKRMIVQSIKCNVEVHAWTVNRANDINRLLRLNIAEIITDVPTLALRLRNRIQ